MVTIVIVVVSLAASFVAGKVYGARVEQKTVAMLVNAYEADRNRAAEIFDEVTNRVKKFL